MKRSKKVTDDSQGDALQAALRGPKKEEQISRIHRESPIKVGELRVRGTGIAPPGLKRAVRRNKLAGLKRRPPG